MNSRIAAASCELILILTPILSASAAVPRASCRKGDRVESGMQGETTQAEVDSGPKEYNCNADLVGQSQGEGASWQLAAWKNCAYYDQANNPNGLRQPGTVVVDVSDPAHPVITEHLTEIAMIDPWESLKVNPPRQLLGGAQQPGPGFALYDISVDCRHPILKSSVVLPGSRGHAGQFAPDGKTFYITTITNNPSIVAVDITDTTAPQVIATWVPPSGASPSPIFHDLEFSKDGNIAYQTIIGGISAIPAATANGLLTLDVSDIQQRRANPTIRILGQITWDDGSVIAQNALPVTIAGKPYVLFTDEAGSFREGMSAGQAACAAGKSANGFPRLIDVSNPANPTTVSKLQIEMADPANCTKVLNAIPISASGAVMFGHSCHYCNVDDASNATVAACSCFSAGMRFFDIRDPAKPKEIGYYKPPAQGTKVLPGSQYFLRAGAGFSRPVDWAPAKPSFPKDRGMASGDIWATFQDNGFTVIRLDRGGGSGGCSTGGAGAVALVGLGVLLLRRRRKVRG
jgi:MYXO-CTERM domain-containing protein